MEPSLTIGIEEEYQTIDPETRDLRSHIDAEIIAKGKTRLHEAVKAEMHQSVVEVGTGVCKDIKEARRDLTNLRRSIIGLARANLIFGLHVHVGIEDRETAIHIMNAARYFVPHILALSTNLPFWVAMDT